jgi:ABC-type uncharacterized transport system auxiliary subunit
MKKRLTATLVTLTFSACLTGCVNKVRFPTYYTLHVPPAADVPTAAATRASVAVCEFRSPAYLRQGAIVYRVSPEQLGFYQYHRWVVDPGEFLTNAIADRLRATGRFAEVKIYDGRSDVDFILSGRLERLEEVDYKGGVRVEVGLSAQMTDLRSGKTVWTNAASESAPVDKRTVSAVVAEMSQAMDRAIQKLLASLPVPTTTSLNPFSPQVTPHPAHSGC